ncbi:hypothetical protein Q7P37_006872 [Cladosporium fusiforme]
MPSTHSSRPVSRAAYALLLLSAAFISSTSAQGLRTMKYQGCYSSSTPLTDQGEDIYQTSGLCQPICVKKNQAVLGLTEGSNCYCGDEFPSEDDKVDDDKCDTHCNGYEDEMCGGHKYWSVYTSGTKNNVDSYEGDSSSSATTKDSASTTAAPESAAVSTSVAPGTTVVVTMPSSQQQTEAAEPSPSAEADSDDGGSSTNVAGIAAGVVVGVVAIAGIAIGLFFFMRHRKRKAAEEEFKRTQVSDFMRHGGTSSFSEGKPPNTGYSNMSDQRLDPEAGRRNSAGSIADGQDYSRRILRVANPDNS